MEPIQTPITGSEPYTDVSTPYHALVKLYSAFNTKSNTLMASCWDTAVPCSNDNQLGGILRTRSDVLSRYAAIFAGPSKIYAEFFDYTIQEDRGWALVVGRERGTFEVEGGKTLEFQTRDTRLLRRDGEGMWKSVHHHGSFEDGDLMREFQAAAGIKK